MPPRRFGETRLVGHRGKAPQPFEPAHDYADFRMSEVTNERIITETHERHILWADGIQPLAPEKP